MTIITRASLHAHWCTADLLLPCVHLFTYLFIFTVPGTKHEIIILLRSLYENTGAWQTNPLNPLITLCHKHSLVSMVTRCYWLHIGMRDKGGQKPTKPNHTTALNFKR